MSRWTFSQGAEVYRLQQNPKAMSTPINKHTSVTSAASIRDGRRFALRAPDVLGEFTFEGKVRSKAHYDLMLAWAGRSGRIRVTDHLGRVHEVFPKAFVPEPVEKSGSPNYWLFAYTFKCLYIRRIA